MLENEYPFISNTSIKSRTNTFTNTKLSKISNSKEAFHFGTHSFSESGLLILKERAWYCGEPNRRFVADEWHLGRDSLQ